MWHVWPPYILLILLWFLGRPLIFGLENRCGTPSSPRLERLKETSFPFSYSALGPPGEQRYFFFLLAHARGLGTLSRSEPNTENFGEKCAEEQRTQEIPDEYWNRAHTWKEGDRPRVDTYEHLPHQEEGDEEEQRHFHRLPRHFLLQLHDSSFLLFRLSDFLLVLAFEGCPVLVRPSLDLRSPFT